MTLALVNLVGAFHDNAGAQPESLSVEVETATTSTLALLTQLHVATTQTLHTCSVPNFLVLKLKQYMKLYSLVPRPAPSNLPNLSSVVELTITSWS